MLEPQWRELICQALQEDVGEGDWTTLATVPAELEAAGQVVAREPLVLAGADVAAAVFAQADPRLIVDRRVQDGQELAGGEVLLEIRGPARGILTAERTALNFLQHMSGIATRTRRYVDEVEGTGVTILDTRKTVPTLRALAKYAVRVGGGANHRTGLFDMILIKDNHLALCPRGGSWHPVEWAIQQARKTAPQLRVEIEVETPEDADIAAAAGADVILLDNMEPPLLREAVRRVGGRARTEASGGISLQTVRVVAETGVDMISVGELTHSVRAADIALDMTPALGSS